MLTREKIKSVLSPYTDIIIFVVTLLVANYFWKFTIHGDEGDTLVTWFGVNITAPFDFLARHITREVYWLIGLFRDTCTLTSPTSYYFDSGVGTSIAWSCTPLKQSFIWLCLLLTVRGGWKHKIWYIPLGWICIYIFNLLRIFSISLLTEFHPDWFELLHTYIFKYLFYGMMFLLWLLFINKVRYIGQKQV